MPSWIAVGMLLAIGTASAQEVVLSRCQVVLIENIDVPAEEAGKLISVEAREGLEVDEGTLLAQIDDAQAVSLRKVAQLEAQTAQEQATNDINIRYSAAAAKVAKAEYDQAIEANRQVPGTISQAEVRRRLLTWNRSDLEIEQARLDYTVADLTHQTKTAEAESTQIGIDRRRIVAPISGLVVEVVRRRGEWVNPGDTVFRVVRMDRLWVEGFVDASQFRVVDVDNRPVVVRAQLPHGMEEFEGKVVFVNPQVEAGGLRVRAEVVNRAVADRWLLLPGLNAAMVINVPGAVRPAAAAGTTEPPTRRSSMR